MLHLCDRSRTISPTNASFSFFEEWSHCCEQIHSITLFIRSDFDGEWASDQQMVCSLDYYYVTIIICTFYHLRSRRFVFSVLFANKRTKKRKKRNRRTKYLSYVVACAAPLIIIIIIMVIYIYFYLFYVRYFIWIVVYFCVTILWISYKHTSNSWECAEDQRATRFFVVIVRLQSHLNYLILLILWYSMFAASHRMARATASEGLSKVTTTEQVHAIIPQNIQYKPNEWLTCNGFQWLEWANSMRATYIFIERAWKLHENQWNVHASFVSMFAHTSLAMCKEIAPHVSNIDIEQRATSNDDIWQCCHCILYI